MQKKVLLILFVLVFLVPYTSGWSWKFPLTSLLLFPLAKILWPRNWRTHLGLAFDKATWVRVLLLTASVFVLSHYLVPYLAQRGGYEYFPFVHWRWKISTVFQVLNEEVVLRALLLSALFRVFRSSVLVSLFTALVFSLLHWILYRYSIEGAVVLTPMTLLNLTLFGLICNLFYLRYNHIGYGYALHLGWNLTRFTGACILNNRPLQEGKTFNLIEGSGEVAFLLGIILVLGFSFLNLEKVSKGKASS